MSLQILLFTCILSLQIFRKCGFVQPVALIKMCDMVGLCVRVCETALWSTADSAVLYSAVSLWGLQTGWRAHMVILASLSSLAVSHVPRLDLGYCTAPRGHTATSSRSLLDTHIAPGLILSTVVNETLNAGIFLSPSDLKMVLFRIMFLALTRRISRPLRF